MNGVRRSGCFEYSVDIRICRTQTRGYHQYHAFLHAYESWPRAGGLCVNGLGCLHNAKVDCIDRAEMYFPQSISYNAHDLMLRHTPSNAHFPNANILQLNIPRSMRSHSVA